MTIYRKRISENVFVVVEKLDGGEYRVVVTNSASQPVDEETRAAALRLVNNELSAMRAHIWFEELGHKQKGKT